MTSIEPVSPALQRRMRDNAAAAGRIVAAARKLFLKYGFENVSMRQIASAAKYTPGALYVHFKDKQELIYALMDQDFGLFGEAMQEASKVADPVERLRGIGRAYVRFAIDHPHHYRLMFMTPLPPHEIGKCGIEHGNPDQDGYACLRATVADCIQQGRFLRQYADIEAVTQTCWAAAHGLVSLYISHGDDPWVEFKEPLETAYMALDMHLDGLTGGKWSQGFGKHARTGGTA